ncbi:MAG: lipid A biosynthesis lauroyl acyltransferase [Gammaproteobacteria bacterium]
MRRQPRHPLPPRPSLALRNWPGWFAVGFLWLLGRLPRPLGRALVAPLGPLLHLVLASRRRIAERNIAVCLPDLDETGRQRLIRLHFSALARMLAETAWCWSGPAQDLQAVTEVRGLEHIEAALEGGRGLLVVTAHLTCLELGARVVGERVRGCGMYRPLGNEVLEWYQNRGRAWYAEGMISKRDIRRAVRHLRGGGVLWYAPDQDFGAAQSVFAPFFGVQAATLLASHRLPRMTGCRVLAMMPRFDRASGRYVVELSPVLEDYPGDDPVHDLARINELLEAQVRKAPEQYWWIHRRFKTRPPGEADFYGSDARG